MLHTLPDSTVRTGSFSASEKSLTASNNSAMSSPGPRSPSSNNRKSLVTCNAKANFFSASAVGWALPAS